MIKQIDPKDIPGRATSWNNAVSQEVRDFAESNWEAASVAMEKYKDANSCRNAYKKAVKRIGLEDIAVISRAGRVFLVKE